MNQGNVFKSEILGYLSNTKLRNKTFDAISGIVKTVDLSNELSIATSLKNIDTGTLRQLKAAFPFESKFGKLSLIHI